MRILASFLLALLGLPALADAVLLKNGERYIGEVTDLGDSLRIKSESHPDGLVVRKSDVKTVYPRPEKLLDKIGAEIEAAKKRYESGKTAADPNADMKAAMEMLFDPELETEDALQIYPNFRREFGAQQTTIHELRKMCRDAQVSGKPPVDNGGEKPPQDPKPADNPPADPRPEPPPIDPDMLLLAPPPEAKPAEIANAAKMMQARATDHGFQGVTAKVVRRGDRQVIEMSAKDGLTPEMKKRLAWFAKRTCQKFEVRAGHALSRAESEQYPTPSLEEIDAGKAKAPAGLKWYRYGDDSLCLLFDKPVITRKDLGKSFLNDDGIVTFEVVNKALATSLHQDMSLRDGKVCAGFYFLGDRGGWGCQDTRLMFQGDPGTRTWLETGFTEADWKNSQVMLDHPLPFALTEIK